MKRSIVVGAVLLPFVVASASAQQTASSACPPGTVGPFGIPDAERATQDACQIAVDVFQVMAPQLGLAISGGNATLGQGGTLGGLGHFSVGLRVNAFNGSLPQVQDVTLSTNGRVQRGQGGSPAIESESQFLGLPTVEAGIGIFKGLPLGVTNVGGIDLLVSASYIPDVNTDAVDVTTDSPLKLGFGARVGLLQESIIVPGVSFTWLRRDLPTVTVSGTTDQGDSLFVRDLSVKTTAWRLVASKSFLLFGLAAGVGQDEYDSSTEVQARVQRPVIGTATSQPIPMSSKMKRTNMFADLSLNLPFTKLVLEVGQVSGGTVTTYNAFSGKAADDSQLYGAIGIRFGF